MGKGEEAAVGKTPPQICAKTHQRAQRPGPGSLQHPHDHAQFARRYYRVPDEVTLCSFREDVDNADDTDFTADRLNTTTAYAKITGARTCQV
jgi:hypothetical protein